MYNFYLLALNCVCSVKNNNMHKKWHSNRFYGFYIVTISCTRFKIKLPLRSHIFCFFLKGSFQKWCFPAYLKFVFFHFLFCSICLSRVKWESIRVWTQMYKRKLYCDEWVRMKISSEQIKTHTFMFRFLYSIFKSHLS